MYDPEEISYEKLSTYSGHRSILPIQRGSSLAALA
jgi:hypothetical protein